MRRITGALAAGALALGIGAAAAAASPAMAQPCGTTSNCVNASLTIAKTITLSVSTTAMTFTGTPGQPSNQQSVAYSVSSNDTAGYVVQVTPTSPNMTGAATAATFTVADINVGGPAQLAAPSSVVGLNCGGVPGGNVTTCSVPLVAAGPVTTDSTKTVSASGGDSATDYYQFVGTGGATKSGGSGSPIPAGLAPDSYSDGLGYIVIGN